MTDFQKRYKSGSKMLMYTTSMGAALEAFLLIDF